MAANPRIVTQNITFTWDGAPQRLSRGQLIDVAADSPLERAIGVQNLVPMFARAAQPAVQAPVPPEVPTQEPAPEAAEEPQDAPASEGDAGTPSAGRGRKNGSAKPGDEAPAAEAPDTASQEDSK